MYEYDNESEKESVDEQMDEIVEIHNTTNNTNGSSEFKRNPLKLDIPQNMSPDEAAKDASIKPLLDYSNVPSLKGILRAEGNYHVCRGVWAMNDALHNVEGQQSNFEFKLQSNSSSVPVNGKYSGWFMLKQLPPKNPIKIDDKEILITFTKSENPEDGNVWNISGIGINKFGNFQVNGKLNEGGALHMYRIYAPKKGTLSAATPKSRLSTTPRNAVLSPRELSNRVRKPSIATYDSMDISGTNVTTPRSKPIKNVAPVVTQINAPLSVSSSGRSQRTSQTILKCSELLKDLSKQLQANYFLEPVDHVKLNIPDYPTVITEPMDFTTIRKNLEGNAYETHDAFAEHMRLVFKNAIAYNTRRDNPVHIAARELSTKFEEKYRIMVSQLTQTLYTDYDIAPAPRPKHKPKEKSKSVHHHHHHVGMSAIPPPALDSNMQALVDMQKRMMDMQNEILQLKSVVRQSEIKDTINLQRAAARDPLTMEEKRTLCSQINRLEGDSLSHVIDIIQNALPSAARTNNDSEDADLEIPLDDLDTFTLRKLQEFVQNAITTQLNKKKRPASIPAAQSNSKLKGTEAKKPKLVKNEVLVTEIKNNMISDSDNFLPPYIPNGNSDTIVVPQDNIDNRNANDNKSDIDDDDEGNYF